MGTLSRIADTGYAIRFLRLLTTKWKDTNAFKHGIIDEEGNQLIKAADVPREHRQYYTLFHRLVFNIKRLINKTPLIGRNILTSYAAGLMMLREETGLSDAELVSVLEEALGEKLHITPVTPLIMIKEDDNSSEVFSAPFDLPCEETGEMLIKEGSPLRCLSSRSFLVEQRQQQQYVDTPSVLEVPVYYCEDIRTGLKTYVCLDEESAAAAITAGSTGVTSNAQSAAVPFLLKNRRHSVFDIDDDTFKNFVDYRKKYKRWSQYISPEHEQYSKIKRCVQRGDMVILRDSKGSACTIRTINNNNNNSKK